jgi:uncharacterized protein YabE (DUF348 family)
MKPAYLLAVLVVSLFSACQPSSPPTVTIIDQERVITLQTDERQPLALLDQAGIQIGPNDRLLLNGIPTAPDQTIIDYPITIQLRRAVPMTIQSPDGEKEIQSSALTIGEALESASVWLRAGDEVEPPPSSPISQSPISQSPISKSLITIYRSPSHDLTITANGQTIRFASSAHTIGQALTEAGFPIVGLDYSVPAENAPIPSDGQIRLVHVTESLQLAQNPIPFESELQASADVPLDQTQVLQPGEAGLTVQRIRIRYEDRQEVSRLAEEETLVRTPKTRILAYGTKIEIKTATVDGVSIEYWRAVQMYATSYSPCRSGTEECHHGTASGKSLRKGMVGLRYSWYLSMQGQRLYIPGYGFASVEDVCGGCVGQPWVDLGFSDENFEPWHSWVTVYFLTPVPSNVIHVLE